MQYKQISIAVFLTFSLNLLTAQNKITIHSAQAKDTINKNIYGHFAEHLGYGVYGGLYVGDTNRSIPNKDGIRLDVVNALKKLKVAVLRWPGGCFADNYHWKDAIGPKNKRKPIENVSWGNVREDNSFGTNEFLELCKMIQAEPYLAVNMGGGTVEEASDWVKYVNHANGTSYLTDLREKSNIKKPWNVKYWGIGNESWDCGGHMTVEYYTNLYKRYATFMTSYSNTEKLFRIAVGPGTEDFNWTEYLMKNIPLKMMEGISIHHYSVTNWSNKGSATNFSENDYFNTMVQAYRMETMIDGNSKVMDQYDPEKKIALIVDEWGGWYEPEPGTKKDFLFQQNTMRDAMIAGLTLNTFNNNCSRVKMANLAQCVNVLQAVILTNKEKIVLTPTYHVMEMFSVHQNALMLPIDLKTNDYNLGDKKIKAISASASKDKNGFVHISLVNLDANKEQKITVDLGEIATKTISGRMLHSNKIQDYNSFSESEKVKPQDFKNFILNNKELSLSLPASSVIVLELK